MCTTAHFNMETDFDMYLVISHLIAILKFYEKNSYYISQRMTYAFKLCTTHFFTRGIATLAALACVNFPLVEKVLLYVWMKKEIKIKTDEHITSSDEISS
jgi:hypothetical protein